MDYFWIRQDQRYKNAPIIENFYTTFKRRDFIENNAVRIPEKNVVFANSPKEQDWVDVLDNQMFAVSKAVRDVFRFYNPFMDFKQFCILNNELDTYGRYFVPVLKLMPCLKQRREKVPVIIRDAISDEDSVFRIEDANADRVMIRLDVAESLLRRNINQYILTKVKVGME